MRIAWIGPVIGNGGVAEMGRTLLEGLLEQGVEVDYFATHPPDQLPEKIRNHQNLRPMGEDCGWKWEWGRWYSKQQFIAFVSGSICRIHNYNKLTELVIEMNRQRNYQVIFQLSQQELFKLGRHRDRLPPIIVHPCSHAAGELRWHRRESRFARKYENPMVHMGVRASLIYRCGVQRREIQKPAFVLGPSKRFNQLLHLDYGVSEQRLGVLRHPLLMGADSKAGPSTIVPPAGPIQLLAVMRISVRKGLEQLIQLSWNLADLEGQVRLKIVGGASLWSDYRGHLKDLNPKIAIYGGDLPYHKMRDLYDQSDVLLVPSLYEPGSLAVGEALSRGLSIVASDEVGPTEVLPSTCCRTFPAGDIAAFEKQVRAMIVSLTADRLSPRKAAIEAAWSLFAPERISTQLLSILESVAKAGGQMPAMCG